MEIRAQAFVFATSDEVNKMTFYNYELVNRGTTTLYNTYFSQFLDPDIGYYNDDYVACDVSRGLGIAYNGEDFDPDMGGKYGYGENPPAIGVDFFEGPYLDADGIDNQIYNKADATHLDGDTLQSENAPWIIFSDNPVQTALTQNGIVYKGIGIGYSDSIIDNERFGMRRFTYFTGGGAVYPFSDPKTASQYYNFMKGNWANGQPMTFGGTGQTPTNTPSSYMFPGDSDPLGWATGGTELGTDFKEASAFGDRRFVQSAGPFTLKPGAFNNITVGVIYARGNEGSAYASVDAVKKADTKAQALFDNCFVILDPPMAPKLTIQELENGLVLMLDNPASSNNYKEGYEKEDKIGITIEHLSDGSVPDKYYRFEGYQIYQLKNASASAADIGHEDKARLVAQCDIKNGVSKLINFEYSDELKFDVPTLKVNGGNKGIQHSFKITEDAFASGTKTLVNHKTYYYVAIAYAYNQYKKYDPNDAYLLEGQKIPYISSRLGYDGVQIKSISAIPHNTKPEADGTNQYVDYGDSPLIKRLDGHGNGNRELELTQASKDEIISVGKLNDPVYENQKGPINIKVIDPLNVADGYFELEFNNFDAGSNNVDLNRADTASWTLYRFDKENGTLLDSVNSQVTIANNNEQLIPKYGVSVQINQASYTGSLGSNYFTEPIASSVDFADSTQRWLFGVPDDQSFYATNWIRSGVYKAQDSDTNKADLWRNPACFDDDALADNERKYTKLAGGMFAPHRVTGFQCDYMPLAYYKMPTTSYNMPSPSNSRTNAKIAFLPSVDIVFTNDPSKWTKCPVIELGRDVNLTVGGAVAGGLRKSLSVDKNGNPDGSGTTGMGWFPGYAIDVESGVRLQMAFGENSFLAGDNGADMVWNPTSTFVDASGNPILGGQHAIYVFGYKLKEINGYQNFYDLHEYKESDLEIYDMLKNIETTNNPSDKRDFYSNLAWVGNPVLTPGQKLNACDLTIKIRVSKEYKKYTATGKNNGKPMYSWNTNTMATKKSDISVLSDVLKMVNVVPNPYYAYSSYERNRVDTRVKITNLPEKCTVKIYSVNGKLMRTFKKDSEITSIDWDLNNQIGVAVSSGVYLIHVEVPGVGERVIKFFGGMRQVDLEGI
ncbi:MAG: T9SS type A sorting domain-containing protein [Flavobacteriia bacterium]|nr:T9SS type A sorting domain-containing protein [Flavobacteriia bacterium]